jgi:hypothetical protein
MGYPSDLTLTVKLLPFNSRGVLALADTYQLKKVTVSRAGRPYVPCAVTINGQSYPASRTGELTVAWAHRNRLGAWSYADAGAVGTPEPGTTYTVRIYGDGGGYGKNYGNVYGGYGKLKRTYAGILGTSQVYPLATEQADNGGSSNTYLRVTIEALLAALGSFQLYDFVVGAGAGYGFNYGNDYGG